MIDQNEIETIKEAVKKLFEKMSTGDFELQVVAEKNGKLEEGGVADIVSIDLKLKDPQFFIGQHGQTLLDLQKIMRMVLCKKTGKNFYLKLDINDYQKQRVEYLKNLARETADQVAFLKQQKTLSPMSSYDRRIIHEELSGRHDVATESSGEGEERCVVITPNT